MVACCGRGMQPQHRQPWRQAHKSKMIAACSSSHSRISYPCSAKTRRRMLKAAPLWKIVARVVRFLLQLRQYDSCLQLARSYSQNFSRETIGKPFLCHGWTCVSRTRVQYYCILKGSVFRQQTSVDARPQNSSLFESAIKVFRKNAMYVSKESNADELVTNTSDS
jgi:hypothetical protein